ncbi:acyl-CoA thioesterase-1 [Skermanella aerolata]|uniref:Arylesterase n=1 Tax=Skermanella aerolata TaxID=393310 RepID=A0A512DL32_9PROT|nr:arylesterase [Skermanella aerolata]KJB92348.1 acyl-CoA thioesterase [Skermanella aerolata KACC 11604]GEO37179.1 arylesterase [Skermanella aerolata]
MRGRLFNAVAKATAVAALGLGVAMTPVAAAEPVKILALGDSLTAGYGLPEADAFTTRLQQALKDKGYDVQVINAGVSGDTTAGGRARLDWALGDQPDVAVVELGANDGLRGLDPASTRENLDAILTVMKERGVPTLLAGMYAPRNLGREYGDRFNAIYPELAAKHDVPLYPFFLEGVALDPKLNQEDGMHPNAKGVAIVVDGILPHLTALIDGLPGTADTGAKGK